jgi:hypothetical protein
MIRERLRVKRRSSEPKLLVSSCSFRIAEMPMLNMKLET